ncbi:MAG: hypothetical protein KAJ98_12730 [Spirochaetaceae bacterium]|nr:hypothetical protein [Spirochaetaceae bacterium]
MEEKGQTGFQRCYTCGKWHPAAGAHSRRFCSRECARSFQRCPVCGEYFNVNSLTQDGFCSAECAGIDEKDRPEMITEITEEPDDP